MANWSKDHDKSTFIAERLLVGGARHIASRQTLPTLGYTLPDVDRNWRSRLLQMIVDHLHKHGD